MTETIIRWAVSVAFMVLAFLWGYQRGLCKGYRYNIEHSRAIADALLTIIKNQENNFERINEALWEQNDK